MKLLYKIQKFMYGRYGIDELYKFLFIIYFVLAMINIFFNSRFLIFIEFIILTTAIYRSLSKNISKRRKENKKYLKLKEQVFKPFINIKRNIQDKEHLYRKCSCGTTLKLPLPKKRGIKHAKCPDCKKRIAFFTLRCEKIIIIPKDKNA